jgi:hypothetical protein
MFQYLDIESNRPFVEKLVQRAERRTPELENHKTVKDTVQSIGRWKRDLDPGLQKLANDVCSEALRTFGYAA